MIRAGVVEEFACVLDPETGRSPMNIALLYRARLAGPQAFDAPGGCWAEIGATRSALGITGFLLVADGYTYELLEGDFSAVSSAFAGVLASTLFSDVAMLSNAAVEKRVCPQWSHGIVSEDCALPAEISAKVQMLHHFATRFGSSQPVLRDFLARIGQDIMAPASRIPRERGTGYALAS
jgi:Sensors of blue-light using FAD